MKKSKKHPLTYPTVDASFDEIKQIIENNPDKILEDFEILELCIRKNLKGISEVIFASKIFFNNLENKISNNNNTLDTLDILLAYRSILKNLLDEIYEKEGDVRNQIWKLLKKKLEDLYFKIESTIYNREKLFDESLDEKGNIIISDFEIKPSAILKKMANPFSYDDVMFDFLDNKLREFLSELDNIEIDENDKECLEIKKCILESFY